MKKITQLIGSIFFTVGLLFISAPSAFADTIKPVTTVREIMTGVIEPTTNALWAVALDENAPKTDEDWKTLENQSIQLLTAAAALSIGGSGPKDVAWAKNPKWQQHLQQMITIGNQYLQASRNKNYQGLLDAGDVLIEPCSNCHTDFPGDSQ